MNSDTQRFEKFFETAVGQLGLILKRIELFHDLRYWSIFLSFSCVDVSAWRQIEVILSAGNIFNAHNTRVFVHFFPGAEGVNDTSDPVLGDIILGVTLSKLAAGVEQEEL